MNENLPYCALVMSSASQPRVLVFGGTFDPPHRAHIELPQAAARELQCSRILYIPAAINPLKATPGAQPPSPPHHRLAMLRLALQDSPNAAVSTVELDRRNTGPSYTIDTLRELEAGAAPSMRYLLIGADQALDFHRWKDWRALLELATPAVMLRPPWTPDSFGKALRQRFDADEAGQWEARTLKSLPMIDLSGTEIRRRIAGGETVDGMLDPRVEAYIGEHQLYRDR